jgi:predicted nuclease of predicted toxin-antitoxin system
MKRYLDDDTSKASLAARLRNAGHQVVQPAHVGTSGWSDARHLLYAVQNDLVLVTKNHDDFEDLHLLVSGTAGQHPGILVVRSDNDASRDMKDQDIARAIGNLETAGVPVFNEFHILNHWR